MTTLAAAPERIQVTRPGVYELPSEVYHADPVPGGSLSASGARKLLPPSCPALYRYEREHPPATRKVFEEGHAAHRLVLGVGPELVRIDADEWRSNVVKAEVAEARGRGAVPLKPAQWDMVAAMAEAIRAHPLAAALLNVPGTAEASVFWQDGDLWRRARLDFLPDQPTTGRPIIVEYKSARSASPEDLPRTIHDYGYAQAADWYLAAAAAAGRTDAALVWLFQEKTPPYLVTIAEPDFEALRIGRSLNRDAMAIYRECVASGRWPGYSDDVVAISLPPWVEAQHAPDRWQA